MLATTGCLHNPLQQHIVLLALDHPMASHTHVVLTPRLPCMCEGCHRRTALLALKNRACAETMHVVLMPHNLKLAADRIGLRLLAKLCCTHLIGRAYSVVCTFAGNPEVCPQQGPSVAALRQRQPRGAQLLASQGHRGNHPDGRRCQCHKHSSRHRTLDAAVPSQCPASSSLRQPVPAPSASTAHSRSSRTAVRQGLCVGFSVRACLDQHTGRCP